VWVIKKIKMIKYLFILLSFLPFTSFAFTYDRSPAGSSITSPVSFTFSATNSDELYTGGGGSTTTHPYWGIYVDNDDVGFFTNCVLYTDLDETFILDLPVGDYFGVKIDVGTDQVDCEDTAGTDGAELEAYTWPSVLFSVVESASSSVLGCMDSLAYNYNASSTEDDGSCITSTSTYILVNTTLKSLNFGIMLILVILSIFLSAFIFNQFSKKKKNFYD